MMKGQEETIDTNEFIGDFLTEACKPTGTHKFLLENNEEYRKKEQENQNLLIKRLLGDNGNIPITVGNLKEMLNRFGDDDLCRVAINYKNGDASCVLSMLTYCFEERSLILSGQDKNDHDQA